MLAMVGNKNCWFSDVNAYFKESTAVLGAL